MTGSSLSCRLSINTGFWSIWSGHCPLNHRVWLSVWLGPVPFLQACLLLSSPIVPTAKSKFALSSLQFRLPAALPQASSVERPGHLWKGPWPSPSEPPLQPRWRCYCHSHQHSRCCSWPSCDSSGWCRCRPAAPGVGCGAQPFRRAPLSLQIACVSPPAAAPAWPWLRPPDCCCEIACSSTCSVNGRWKDKVVFLYPVYRCAHAFPAPRALCVSLCRLCIIYVCMRSGQRQNN